MICKHCGHKMTCYDSRPPNNDKVFVRCDTENVTRIRRYKCYPCFHTITTYEITKQRYVEMRDAEKIHALDRESVVEAASKVLSICGEGK